MTQGDWRATVRTRHSDRHIRKHPAVKQFACAVRGKLPFRPFGALMRIWKRFVCISKEDSNEAFCPTTFTQLIHRKVLLGHSLAQNSLQMSLDSS